MSDFAVMDGNTAPFSVLLHPFLQLLPGRRPEFIGEARAECPDLFWFKQTSK